MSEQVTVQAERARTLRDAKVRELLRKEKKSWIKKFYEGITERHAIENELYFVITYLYGLATSYCSLLDMFSYVASSEFKRCATIFNRIRVLARTWHFGFVNALEEVAKQSKSPLLKDFLERFSQMLKTGEVFDKFLMMEHEAYVVAYEAEYERNLKSMENLGNAYSAIVTSVTFVAITLTLTNALIGSTGGANMGPVSSDLGLALVATLLTSVLALYFLAPVDRFIYLHKDLRIPKEFTKLRKIFPVSLIASVLAPLLLFLLVPLARTAGWMLLAIAIPLLPAGLIAKRADNSIKVRENAFPTFIRTLGTTAGITGYSTAKTLKLLLVRDFGVLSIPVKALHARLAIGVDSGLCWKNLASECGSEMIRVFGGIYEATVSLGGDPGEIGKMISRNMIRRLVLRAKRIQVANGITALIYPLHIITCALLAFMTSLLEFLVKMVNVGAQYSALGGLGLFNSSIDSGSIAPLFTAIMIVMAIANAIALKISEVSNIYRLLYHLSLMLILTAVVLIGVSATVDVLFKSMFNFNFNLTGGSP